MMTMWSMSSSTEPNVARESEPRLWIIPLNWANWHKSKLWDIRRSRCAALWARLSAMMINPNGLFLKHSQWPTESFRPAGLESWCGSSLDVWAVYIYLKIMNIVLNVMYFFYVMSEMWRMICSFGFPPMPQQKTWNTVYWHILSEPQCPSR